MSAEYIVLVIGRCTVAEAEKRLIQATMDASKSKEDAAVKLGLSLKTVYNKLKLYEAEDRAGEPQCLTA